jgi:hypothetical protein
VSDVKGRILFLQNERHGSGVLYLLIFTRFAVHAETAIINFVSSILFGDPQNPLLQSGTLIGI